MEPVRSCTQTLFYSLIIFLVGETSFFQTPKSSQKLSIKLSIINFFCSLRNLQTFRSEFQQLSMPLNLKQDMYDIMYYSWQGGFLHKANIEKYYVLMAGAITLYNLHTFISFLKNAKNSLSFLIFLRFSRLHIFDGTIFSTENKNSRLPNISVMQQIIFLKSCQLIVKKLKSIYKINSKIKLSMLNDYIFSQGPGLR